MYEATEATKKLAEAETQRLSALDEALRLIVSIDPQAKANADWQKLLELQKKAVDENGNQILSLEQIGLAYADMEGAGKDAMSQMSKYAEAAAKNIETALADFLFDPFKGGLDGMLTGFVTMLRRMAGETAAANIMEGVTK